MFTFQVTEYYDMVMSTTVLHEGDEGQDWADNKPFFEGDRISTAIQVQTAKKEKP